MLKRRIFFLTIFVSFFVLIGLANSQAAGKFSTEVTREYWVQEDFSVRVKETEKVTNNTSNLYIPSGSEKQYDILAIEIGNEKNKEILQRSVDTATLKYGSGSSLNFTSQIKDDLATLKVSFPKDLNPGQSITFTFEYTHFGMVEKNGSLVDVFLNGFAEDSVFSDSRNTTSYNTHIYVPVGFPQENFVVPKGATKSQSGANMRYSFSQDQLLGNYVWIQLGRSQIFKFNISQKVNASEGLNTGNQNRYEIVIPRSIDEAQVKQTIYYTNISPAPDWIKEDEEGNLLASFKLKSNFEGEIVLEGYAALEMKDGVNITNFGSLDEIDSVSMARYLGSAQYWEVTDPTISSKATSLKASEVDIYKLVANTYQFVVDQIDYSEVKRFGLNERQGAAKTLEGGSAVCMEYSDLFLSLMRAQGVPARAAFGYGYDPKLPSEEQEGHQWVEVYSPTLDKWVSIDVTWGESGPALIGGDLNHFYTHIAAVSPNEPPGIASVGFGDLNLEPASYDIDVLDSMAEEEWMTTEDLLQKYPYTGSGIADDALDLVRSKLEATFTNLRDGEELSSDQILILVAIGSVGFGGLVISGGLFRKLVKERK